jgi:hypothetical protein
MPPKGYKNGKPPSNQLNPNDKRLKQNKTKNISKSTNVTVSQDGETVIDYIYCRRCMQSKKVKEFFKATDVVLDKNGHQSICKDCISELYVLYYNMDKSIDRAMLRLCRLINWKYDSNTLESAKKQLATNDAPPDFPGFPGY